MTTVYAADGSVASKVCSACATEVAMSDYKGFVIEGCLHNPDCPRHDAEKRAWLDAQAQKGRGE